MEQVAVVSEGQPLSQGARVIDTFVAPSKTFNDIRRSASWWLPFVLMCIVSWASTFAVDRTVGFATVAQHEIEKNPSTAEQLQQLSPAERAQRYQVAATWTKGISYVFPIFILAIVAIEALVLWGSFNFGLGAQTTFPQMFAVVMYAGLPKLFIWILSVILLFAGINTDNYDMRNPVGTNIGYFLNDAPTWMKTAGSFFDVFSLWSLVLLIIGTAIISRKSKAQAAMIVIGWWAIVLVVSTAMAAIRS